MPTLQSSGQISLLDIANVFGGASPHSINEYYRGGGLVPLNGGENTREPSSGYNYSIDPNYYWSENISVSGVYDLKWNNLTAISGGLGTAGLTSWTNPDGITYYRDTYITSGVDSYTGNTLYYYGIYRFYSTPLNTDIPKTGQLRLSNFYGGYKP